MDLLKPADLPQTLGASPHCAIMSPKGQVKCQGQEGSSDTLAVLPNRRLSSLESFSKTAHLHPHSHDGMIAVCTAED